MSRSCIGSTSPGRRWFSCSAVSIEASGGRLVYCSFDEDRVAPVYIGAEDPEGHRYGMLVYRSTTTSK